MRLASSAWGYLGPPPPRELAVQALTVITQHRHPSQSGPWRSPSPSPLSTVLGSHPAAPTGLGGQEKWHCPHAYRHLLPRAWGPNAPMPHTQPFQLRRGHHDTINQVHDRRLHWKGLHSDPGPGVQTPSTVSTMWRAGGVLRPQRPCTGMASCLHCHPAWQCPGNHVQPKLRPHGDTWAGEVKEQVQQVLALSETAAVGPQESPAGPQYW